MKIIRSLGAARDRMWPGWIRGRIQNRIWCRFGNVCNSVSAVVYWGRAWGLVWDRVLFAALYASPITPQSVEILSQARQEAAK